METKIQSTTNYGLFKIHPLNRKVCKAHLLNLTMAIEKNNQLDINPIIVDKDFYVISGQHRLEVAKKLGLPIYYIQKDVESEYILQANLNQRATSLADAVDFYITTTDNEDYKLLKEWRKEFIIPYGAICQLLSYNIGKHSEISNGRFKLPCSIEEAHALIHRYRRLVAILKDMGFVYKTAYMSTHFCAGFKRFCDLDGIDFELFLLKVRQFWHMLDCAQPTAVMWTKKFLQIYNKRRQNRTVVEGMNDEEE